MIKPDILYFENLEFLNNLYNEIYNSTDWQEEYIKIFGKTIKCPRKVAWYGDPDIYYKYSDNNHISQGWTPVLEKIKNHTEKLVGSKFNFALLNYYENGGNYMGWHSDSEKSLGEFPVIASISLGGSRIIKFKHKVKKITYDIKLVDSSLLIMKGTTQLDWLHTIPKTKIFVPPRINITFRLILNDL